MATWRTVNLPLPFSSESWRLRTPICSRCGLKNGDLMDFFGIKVVCGDFLLVSFEQKADLSTLKQQQKANCLG